MVSSKQLHALMRDPAKLMRFQATGQVPRMVRPQSPLITLLSEVNASDRVRIVGLTVDGGLGYLQSRQFQTAEQALRWVRPDVEMEERESWPAESYRDKRFDKQLYLEDVLDRASSYANGIMARHPQLCWSSPRNPGGQLLAALASSQLAVDNNRIEHEGNGWFRFSGSFASFSKVFNFRARAPEVVKLFCEAIFANRAAAGYLADVKYREDAAGEYHAGLEMTGNQQALREAQAESREFRPVSGRVVKGTPVPQGLAETLGLSAAGR